jgi:hypothetical protein
MDTRPHGSHRPADDEPGLRPERVVAASPPQPDYPRYRVKPGVAVRLANVNPAESEHYEHKNQVGPELDRHRTRIRDCKDGCTPSTDAAC